jgi:uncharacterized membrane protein
MHKKRLFWGTTSVAALTAVLILASFGIIRADEGSGTVGPPAICAELTNPESAYTGVASIWLRDLCGATPEKAPATTDAAPVVQLALSPDVPVNDPSGDGGQAYAQSTTSSAINANTGSVCTAYIDTFHGQNEGTGYIGFSRSTDDGATFEDKGSIDDSVLNYGNPSLVWRASDGYFYLTSPLNQDQGTGVWRSTDDCQSFDYFSNLDLRLEYGVDDMQILAVDNSPSSPYYGRFYVVWYGEFDTIQFSRSDDATAWSGRVTVSSNANFDYITKTPWITTGPDGGVYILWNQNSYPWDSDWAFSIEGVHSGNGGDTFAPIASPLTAAVMPRDASVDCGFRVPGLLGGIAYYPPPPQIVAGADGVLHMVYSYDPDGFDTGDVVDVFYRRSLDNGQSWEPEMRLNDDATTTDQYFPTLSVNEHGRVVASWYDRRDDAANNFLFKYYMRTSFDNGATWEASEAVSDVQSPVFADPTVMQCYHGFYDQQLQTTDSAYLFWSDNRNITAAVYDPDVFSERIDYPADFALTAVPASQSVCTTNDAVYDVALASIGGYANPVTLSAGGEPAGATVTFGVNPATPDAATTLTVANLAGATPGSYMLTITGTEGALNHAADVDLHLADVVPAGVTLTAPADTAVDQPVTPTFTWSTDTTAVTHTIQIATDAAFTNIIYSAETSDTSHTPAAYLDANTTYYWRVIGHNGCGDTTTAAFSFTTITAPAILLVDDDDNSPDVQGYYTATLDALALGYDVWDTNGGDNQPQESDLAPYDMVIWFTGGDYSAGPDAAAEAALTAWLPQDNCVFISSQAYLSSITAFRSQYLGVRSFFGPYPPYYSVSGEWVVYGGLGPYDLSYPFYESPKAIFANAIGQPAFIAGADFAGVNVDSPLFKSTTLGFPLEAADDAARQEVLATALDWCSNGVEYGSITGVVTDLDSTLPIKNAAVTADNGSFPITFYTDANGSYSSDLRTGSYTVTVAAANYQSQTFTGIVINDSSTTTLDVVLQGSLLSYAPAAVEDTVTLGDVTTQTITLSASGPLDVEVALTPYTTLLDRTYGIYASENPQPTIFHFSHNDPTDLTLMGSFPLGGSVGGDFFGDDFSVVYALADQGDSDNTNDQLVKIDTLTGAITVVGTLPPAPGWEQYSAMGYDPVTNQMYVISSYADFFGTGGKSLHTIDVNTAQTTLLGALLSPNQMEVGSLAFDDNGTLYLHDRWSQELATVDLDTLVVTYITSGGMQPFTEFNSGMDWDPVTQQMYVTVFSYTDNSRLYSVDLQTGITTFVEEFGSIAPGNAGPIAPTWIAFASAPLPWATAVPDQLTIPANSSVDVDVALDTTGLYELGDYSGGLAFSGTHVNALASQPITLHVTCAACGVLNGDVLDAWFNDAVAANLHITGDTGMDILLTGVDSYAVTVPAGNYTIAAAAAGYLSEVVQVTAVSATTTTTDISLTPAASFLEYGPASVAVTAEIGDQVTETITVSNTGTTTMTFAVRLDNFDVPTAVRNAALSAITSDGQSALAPVDILAYGVQYQGVGGQLAWFNLNTPTSIESSGNVITDHGSLRGGDFWGDDYSRLYAFEESKLIALDVPTGDKEIIGALPMISTYRTYPGMAYEPVTDQMYILHAYECYLGYSLYTVDVTTAAATYVAPVTGTGCLDSLTADDQGNLYTIDTDSDTLVSIDPATGTATVVGSLGFDANTFLQGLAWDSATNQLYYAATDVSGWPFVQKLYLVSKATGAATEIADMGLSDMGGLAIASDAAEWVNFPTYRMEVPPGMQVTFDLTFDLRSMVQTGDYASEMIFDGNFINEPANLPVSLALGCTNCAVLDGAITAAATGDPLPARLDVTGPNGFAYTGQNKDAYALTVQPGEYTIQVSRDGYVTQSVVVTAVANATTTTNFALTASQAEISYDPAALDVVLPVGETAVSGFSLTNDGHAPFDFTVFDSDWSGNMLPTVPYTSCGAADAFGYSCLDSNAPDTPISYNWVDISATGTPLGLSGANDFYAPLPIPFDFTYYGNSYNELAVGSYGQVFFEDRQPDPNYGGHQPIPTDMVDGVQTFIAPLWGNHTYDDIVQTHYAVQGVAPYRRVIIQWSNLLAGWWPYSSVTFQVILFEEGNILMQYHTLNGLTGDSATIGIQGDALTGLQYGFDQAVLADELAVCYLHPDSTNYDCSLQPPDAAWMSQSPTSGVVGATETVDVEVLWDATAVLPGLYSGNIHFGNSYHDPMMVAATMRVVNMELLPAEAAAIAPLGETVQYALSLTNIGAMTDTFTIAAVSGWQISVAEGSMANLGDSLEVTLAPQETVELVVTVGVPADAEQGDVDTAVITATSNSYSESFVEAELTTTAQNYQLFLPVLAKP